MDNDWLYDFWTNKNKNKNFDTIEKVEIEVWDIFPELENTKFDQRELNVPSLSWRLSKQITILINMNVK